MKGCFGARAMHGPWRSYFVINVVSECVVQRTPQAVPPYHLDASGAQYPDQSQPLHHMQHNTPPPHPHLTSPHHPEPHAPVMNSSGGVDWPSTPREERGFVNSSHPTSARDYADIWSHGDPFGGHFLPFKPPPSTEWQVCWIVVDIALGSGAAAPGGGRGGGISFS